MKLKKITLAVVTSAAAGMFALGGLSVANAETATPAPAASGSAPADGTKPARGPKGTPVTGDELAKVTAAVVAKDSGVTVGRAHKASDGTYDVFGTKDGARVKFDVSADLQTVTQSAARQGKPGGGDGRQAGTPLTGDELAKVTAAVTAKNSGVTVTRAHKEPDGTYDVFGTKDGAKVKFDVSADLQTVTQGTARQGKGGGGGGAKPAAPSTAPTG